MDSQEKLNIAALLAAGLMTYAEASTWAESKLTSSSSNDAACLSEFILAASNSSTLAHDLVLRLEQGVSGSRYIAVALVAKRCLKALEGGQVKAEEAFAQLQGAVSVLGLNPKHQSLFNHVAGELSAWPHNMQPYGEITGELIPRLFRNVAEHEEGTGPT